MPNNGTSSSAYYYKKMTGRNQYDSIMGVASVTNISNIVLYGIDWRHFDKLSNILRATKDFYASFGGDSLPVELMSFDAIIRNNNVNLTWKTASELNSKSFIIEERKETEITGKKICIYHNSNFNPSKYRA